MIPGWETVLFVLGRVKTLWLDPRVGGGFLSLVVVFLVAVRLRFGPDGWRHLLARSVRTDALYSLFYVGGFYAFLISGPLYRLLTTVVEQHAPFLRMNLLAGLPAALQFPVASIAMDGVLYWAHRWAHANPWLWAFHSIHHSAQDLTPLSNFRFHFVDVTVKGLLQFPFALVLGVPTGVWIATVWIQVALDGLAHSGLDWSYGPLGRFLVSPRFHRIHHSTEPVRYRSNFGLSYSFWDALFETSDDTAARPAAYGVPELHVPESFVRQLAFPFILAARAGVRGRGEDLADPKGAS